MYAARVRASVVSTSRCTSFPMSQIRPLRSSLPHIKFQFKAPTRPLNTFPPFPVFTGKMDRGWLAGLSEQSVLAGVHLRYNWRWGLGFIRRFGGELVANDTLQSLAAKISSR